MTPPLDRAEWRMVPGLLLDVAGAAWRMRREIGHFIGIAARLAWMQLRDEIDDRRSKPTPIPSAMPIREIEPWPTVSMQQWPQSQSRGQA